MKYELAEHINDGFTTEFFIDTPLGTRMSVRIGNHVQHDEQLEMVAGIVAYLNVND